MMTAASPRQAGTVAALSRREGHESAFLSGCNFLSKGWEVSLLGLLVFIQKDFSLSLTDVGLLSTIFIVSQITVSLFAGRIAHTIQGQNVIRIAIGMSGLAWLTLVLAQATVVIYLSYVLGGLSSGLFEPIATSLIAKRSAGGRATGIANFAACGDMGRIALVAFVTSLSGFLGLKVACVLLLVTTVAAMILSWVLMPKSPEGEASNSPVRVPLPYLLQNSRFCFATAAGIVDSFSSASLYIFIPFLLAEKGIALSNTLYFNVVFFGGYMAGRLVLGRIADKYGAARILIGAEILMAIFILLLTAVSGKVVLPILLFLLGMFTRGTSPIVRAMVADSMDADATLHEAFSVYSFASRGSTALCRPLYGYLASSAGISVVFYLASAVSLLTVYPAARYQKQ